MFLILLLIGQHVQSINIVGAKENVIFTKSSAQKLRPFKLEVQAGEDSNENHILTASCSAGILASTVELSKGNSVCHFGSKMGNVSELNSFLDDLQVQFSDEAEFFDEKIEYLIDEKPGVSQKVSVSVKVPISVLLQTFFFTTGTDETFTQTVATIDERFTSQISGASFEVVFNRMPPPFITHSFQGRSLVFSSQRINYNAKETLSSMKIVEKKTGLESKEFSVSFEPLGGAGSEADGDASFRVKISIIVLMFVVVAFIAVAVWAFRRSGQVSQTSKEVEIARRPVNTETGDNTSVAASILNWNRKLASGDRETSSLHFNFDGIEINNNPSGIGNDTQRFYDKFGNLSAIRPMPGNTTRDLSSFNV